MRIALFAIVMLAALPAKARFLRLPSPGRVGVAHSQPLVVRPIAEDLVFSVGLDRNGITPADPASSWPVPGVPTPDGAWWADDPLGSGGESTETWTAVTASGAITEKNSPYCPDGSWNDVSSGCMKSKYFPTGGNSYYLASASTVWSPGAGDFSACVVARPSVTGSGTVVDARGASTGWKLERDNSNRMKLTVTDTDSQSVSETRGRAIPALSWSMYCVALTYSTSTIRNCDQVGCEQTAGALTGSITNSQAPRIGSNWRSDLISVFYWEGTALSDAQMRDFFDYFAGIEDGRTYTSPTFVNVGSVCCHIGGEVECFDDDMPRLGCEIPPSSDWTGDGDPSDHYTSCISKTNSITYSRDLSNGWTEVGTGVVACSQSETPFRDGRTTCTVTDDFTHAAQGLEYITQTIAGHGLSNGDDVTMCADVRSSAGSTLTLSFQENTGAGCTYPITTESITATTSWERMCTTHTIADSPDCADIDLLLLATDLTPSNTGVGNFTNVQVVLNNGDFIIGTIETTAAAVTACDDSLGYDISGLGFLNGSGEVFKPISIYADFTPLTAQIPAATTIWQMDNGSDAKRHRLEVTTSETFRWVLGGTAVLTSGAQTFTPGEIITLRIDMDYADDSYEMFIDGSSETTDATARSSQDSLDTFNVGVSGTGDSQGLIVGEVKIIQR
jgi:hypothetical protein